MPRALAAFVKRPQAALLKSALGTFYMRRSCRGQTNVIVFFSGVLGTLFLGLSSEQRAGFPAKPVTASGRLAIRSHEDRTGFGHGQPGELGAPAFAQLEAAM